MNLSFKLTGKDWIGLYLAVLVIYLLQIFGLQILPRLKPTTLLHPVYAFGAWLFSMLLVLILVTPILKKFIGNIYIEDKPLAYDGKTGGFFWLNIWNAFFSLITLFIYFPWYAVKVLRYIVSKTSYNGNRLSFKGKGGNLFVVLLLTFVVPIIVITTIMGMLIRARHPEALMVSINFFTIVNQIVTFILLVPYFYYVYRWTVNLSYKDYLIKWHTQAIPSMGTILREFMLTVITVGIYHPVAIAKLYEYFVSRTVITQQSSQIYSFGVKFDYFRLWKFIWVQILLTIVTAGIYGAWAYCKSVALFVNSTSIIKTESA